ncbi:hypothetical protein BGW38_003350 [Lunasporangiospora selenospora]|uniref:Uncharacterized protein n=1 Tax=Lunasporangiospora selenospora TaxID=979761 RepID=A0A9P6FQT3_9FUNG|nr:hypothetical protein BGW38_003350 [Lunasporangiospora selenospora]
MTMKRESFLAALPRPLRHRAYAAGPHRIYYHPLYDGQHPGHLPHPLTGQRNPHHSGWPSQSLVGRTYPGSTLPRISAGVGHHPALGGPGDVSGIVLRPLAGSLGVNKAHFKSRLPIHLRHITSRTSRRPAICLNPFQILSPEEEAAAAVTLSDRSQDSRNSNEMASDHRSRDATSMGRSFSSAPSSMTFNRPSIGSIPGASLSQGKVIDWRRTSSLDWESKGEAGSQGSLLRLNDLSLSSSSSSDQSFTREGSSSLRNRLKANHHSGLVNLIQTPSSTKSTFGGSASAVERLVEEMNKWTV